MHRFSFRSSLLVLASLTAFASGSFADASEFTPFSHFPKVGHYKALNHSVWNQWAARHIVLGNCRSDEHIVTGTMTQCTEMSFENGMIVRLSSGVRAGTTSVVSGAIFHKYMQLGGMRGRLGLPVGNPYDLHGHSAQNFEKAQIYYNTTIGRYDVHYYGD